MIGLPLREALQSLYRIKRDKAIGECLRFSCFTCVMLLVVWLAFTPHIAFSANAALTDLLLDEEFDSTVQYRKNFYEIMTKDEWWQWVQGPVQRAMFPTKDYAGAALPDIQRGYVLQLFRLVGGLQIRQARVSNSSCLVRRFVDNCVRRKVSSRSACRGDQSTYDPSDSTCCEGRFDTKAGVCYSEFDLAVSDRHDEHPMVRKHHTYTWSPGGSELDGLFGYGQTYGTGGVSVVLKPFNASGAIEMLQQMKEDMFLDLGTRALLVTACLYNTQTRMLTVIRVLTEWFPDANVVKFARFYTVPMLVYTDRTDMLRAFGEVALVLFFVYYIQKEARRFRHTTPNRSWTAKLQHWGSKANSLFFLLWMSVAVALAGHWAAFTLSSQRLNFDVNTEEFVDYFPLTELYVTAATLAAGLCLLVALMQFAFMSVSKRFVIVWLLLSRAAWDITAFGIAMLILIGGLSYAGEMIFGSWIESFRSLMFSFSSLLKYPLGDFGYEELSARRPILTPFFFGATVILTTYVSLNLVIAIINKFYSVVKAASQFRDQWKASATSFEAVRAADAIRSFRTFKSKLTPFFKWAAATCCPCTKTGVVEHRKRASTMARVRASLAEQQSGAGRRGSTAAGRTQSVMRDADKGMRILAADTEEETSAEDDHAGREAELHFFKLLRSCARAARRIHNIDLLTYMETTYVEAGTDFMFIGVQELCALTQPHKPPPAPRPGCLAVQLLHAYKAWKRVIIAGPARQHMRTGEEVVLFKDSMVIFGVKKLSRKKMGLRQDRLLYIDRGRGFLLTFDKFMNLRRRLPLTQLLQFRRDRRNPLRVALVFTSQGMPPEDEEVLGSLETVMRIELQQESRVEELLSVLRAVKSDLESQYEQLSTTLGIGAIEGMHMRLSNLQSHAAAVPVAGAPATRPVPQPSPAR